MKIALLIIAAGRSARLGQPKQLLPFKNTFLLDYIINECQASEIGDIFVVLGANRELIEPKLNKIFLKKTFYNAHWANGMELQLLAVFLIFNVKITMEQLFCFLTNLSLPAIY